MTNRPVERWEQLCEQAAKEHNSKKLRELVAEINILLEGKLARDKDSSCHGGTRDGKAA